MITFPYTPEQIAEGYARTGYNPTGRDYVNRGLRHACVLGMSVIMRRMESGMPLRTAEDIQVSAETCAMRLNLPLLYVRGVVDGFFPEESPPPPGSPEARVEGYAFGRMMRQHLEMCPTQ